MARLSKSRKREIRLAVRSIVACEVRNMDRKNFDNIGESEEENLYIADSGNHCIRKVTPEGVVSTVIGNPNTSGYKDGTPEIALFTEPWGLAIDSEGTIYIGDKDNRCVRKLSIE